jgi:hypothetical protein
MRPLPDHGRDFDSLEFSDLDKFQRHIIDAKRIVASWPAWKRNLLGNSLKPTVEVPRNPVVPVTW